MSGRQLGDQLGPGTPVTEGLFPSLVARPSLYPGIPESLENPTGVGTWPVDYLLHDRALWPLTLSRGDALGDAVAGGGKQLSLTSLLTRLGVVSVEGRIPVVAVGSNAYPRQLTDKFDGTAIEGTVPAFRGVLGNARIAYCPRVASKGYVPVTPFYEPPHGSHAWLQLLSVNQLELIIRTEGPYHTLACRERGDGISFTVTASGETLPETLIFWHPTALGPDPGGELPVLKGSSARAASAGLSQESLISRFTNGRRLTTADLEARSILNPTPPGSHRAEPPYPVYGP